MISFDVFDTLITRRVAEPYGIFLLVQSKIKMKKCKSYIPPEFAAEFLFYRLQADKLARKKYCINGIQDITLAQIYEIMVDCGFLTTTSFREVMQLEIETELENVVGIPQNIQKLKNYLEAGEHVVLISDMYLDEIVIRKMLQIVDPIFSELPIYVSSQTLKGKGSGDMFAFVQQKEDVSYQNWTHIGDHYIADYRIPKSLSISCIKTKAALHPTACQNVLNTMPRELLPQQLTGLSREVCLQEGLPKEARVGAYIGAPILYLYVDWIIRRAQEMGITRLYFIARDGYPLKLIADEIIAGKKSTIIAKYIYGSRHAWRPASFLGTADDCAQIIKYAQINLRESVAQLAAAFGLTEDELRPYLPTDCETIDLSNSYQRQTVLDLLQTNEAFLAYFLKKNQEKRELVRAYFQQELDLSDEHFAFVEVNGSGYTQKCAATLLADWVTQPIMTFY
jgi:predicted HAD superfamily hydrolase